jgi:hypothetical protein
MGCCLSKRSSEIKKNSKSFTIEIPPTYAINNQNRNENISMKISKKVKVI